MKLRSIVSLIQQRFTLARPMIEKLDNNIEKTILNKAT